MINKNLKIIITIAVIMLLLDILYLTLFSVPLSKVIENVQKSPLKLNIPYASIAYIFMVLLVFYFGFIKKVNTFDIFLLGLFTYGVYEFTNMATFNNFSIWMASLEPIWGGLLFATTFYITKNIFEN